MKGKRLYKLYLEAEEADWSDGSYRLLECLVCLVWRSSELALPKNSLASAVNLDLGS